MALWQEAGSCLSHPVLNCEDVCGAGGYTTVLIPYTYRLVHPSLQLLSNIHQSHPLPLLLSFLLSPSMSCKPSNFFTRLSYLNQLLAQELSLSLSVSLSPSLNPSFSPCCSLALWSWSLICPSGQLVEQRLLKAALRETSKTKSAVAWLRAGQLSASSQLYCMSGHTSSN